MFFLKLLILAVVQGLAELLPVSSSAHVIVAEKLMHLDPSSPPMTLLLVMLHTGTMFAVIFYFWNQWRRTFFESREAFLRFAGLILLATILTGAVGEGIIKIIEKTIFRGLPHAEIEDLFSHLEVIAPALAAAGLLILWAGLVERWTVPKTGELSPSKAALIGVVQGLCLPFRGFSRSGATISAAMLANVYKPLAESFSFALAVVLTPVVVAREGWRLTHSLGPKIGFNLSGVLLPSLLGAFLAFLAGLLALKWLSRWLESGRWYLFGIYCLCAAAAVAFLHHAGY